MASSALRSVQDITEFLRERTQPVFFVSRTATHLLGLDRFAPSFSFVVLRDSWDGSHPRVFSPSRRPSLDVRGNINIVNWLLQHSETQQHIAAHTPEGERPQIFAMFVDAQTERLCERLGYELILPPSSLRERLDSKIVTTQLGNETGVLSVPNVLTRVETWADLQRVAAEAGLGDDLVLQSPYGNAGMTTYFVRSEADFDRVRGEVTGIDLKVMRRINHIPIAIDAILTSAGVVVGPRLREITGHPELTKYRGGWAGNEGYRSLLSDAQQARAEEMVRRFGERLGAEGYRGVFEIDLLLDTDTGELYLGELNPRISGATPVSNLSLAGASGLPLSAYHLLEYSGATLEFDPAAIASLSDTVWSHMLIHHTSTANDRVLRAPSTGRYRLNSAGSLEFVAADLDWYDVAGEDEAFFMRVTREGDVRMEGDDLGVLVTQGRLQGEDGQLTDRARHLIAEVQRMYETRPVSALVPFAQRVRHRLREAWARLRR